MEEREKQLLLKDICTRLPYGVVLDVDTTDWKAPQGHIQVKIEGVGLIFKDQSLIVNGSYYGDNYKPYLRPMESMTIEEQQELNDLDIFGDDIEFHTKGVIEVSGYVGRLTVEELTAFFDWLLEHHFDFRGLIYKGLASPAPEGMYK